MAPTKTKQKTHTQHGICRFYQGREHEGGAPSLHPERVLQRALASQADALRSADKPESSLGAFPMAASVWSPEMRACAQAL